MLKGGKPMRGGEVLQSSMPAQVAKQQMIDMRALPFDETCGYVFNGSIAISRYQQFFPLQPVSTGNTIIFELAPTGSPADWYDFYNSFFAMDWTWTLSAGPASTQGATFGMFHSLLYFSVVRIFINGTEVDDESNNYQHICDWSKVIFQEPFTPMPTQIYNGYPSGALPRQALSTGIFSPPYSAGQCWGDDGAGVTRMMWCWMQEVNAGAAVAGTPATSGELQTKYKPYQSVFRNRDFVPCSQRIRFEFTKFDSTSWSFATLTPNIGGGTLSDFVPTLTQMTLFARICTLTNQTLAESSKLAVSNPLVYGMLRASTTRFPLKHGDTQINIQVTGNRRPQVIVLQMVIANLQGPSTRTHFHQSPFSTSVNFTGLPLPLCTINSLYLRCGSQRYPAVFDKSRATWGNGCSGGTSIMEYMEYANCTKAFMDGDDAGIQPFLSEEFFQSGEGANVWVFNMAPAGETFQERSIIETMNITGTVDILMTLAGSGLAADAILFVTTLTNDKWTLDAIAGRVGKTW